MKLTTTDVKEVVRAAQSIGSDPKAERTQTTAALMMMLQDLPDYQSLIKEIPMHILLKGIELGQTDQSSLLSLATQLGVLTGVTIGFQLGLREAGLELGIGASAGSGKE